MDLSVNDEPLSRREMVRLAVLGAGGAAWRGLGRGTAAAQGAGRPVPPDAPHRVQIDVPILADDPVSVPLTVSVDHPMEPDHYVRSLEVTLDTDPVPRKGTFRFTPLSGRASVAYQMRSGQGGELRVVAECTRHGRFEARQPVRVAAGGCAVPPGSAAREGGGTPSVRLDGRAKAGEAVPLWASLTHSSHTGLSEKQGQFRQERPPFFVERMTVFVGDQKASEFVLTSAASPDPKLRCFVRAGPGQSVRVVFVNNRGQQWEASQRVG